MHDLLTNCITKIVGTTIDDAEDLDLVMCMYKLFLNNRSKDEVTNFNADIANENNVKSFMYKAKLLESKVADEANENLRNATIAVLLK